MDTCLNGFKCVQQFQWVSPLSFGHVYLLGREESRFFSYKKATKTDDWCTIRSQIVSFSFLNWNNCTSPIEWLAAIVAGTLRAMPKHPILNRCNRNKLHFCAATIKTIYCRIVAHVALLEYNNIRAHTVRKRVTYKQKHTPHTHTKNVPYFVALSAILTITI